ncbi:MAG: hypothetical protein ABS69_11650 [Nitrosomonadales bacterium SCN 54-20]|nr:MAG: hypothetical protein ABS69_11650 [Nitrosomonadales bacterium SCN 54-20]
MVYLINQLDLTAIPTLESLKPSDFIFKPLQTPSNNEMLQLFIMTGGRAALNYSQAFLNNIPEPIPQGQSNSMMVRSALIFKDVRFHFGIRAEKPAVPIKQLHLVQQLRCAGRLDSPGQLQLGKILGTRKTLHI